jgi:hypothetical protein
VRPGIAGALPAVLGAAAVVALIEHEGGDLGAWKTWQATAALGALFAVPALLSAWVARCSGVAEALAWALVCIGAQVVLVFGVGFAWLGFGPG